MFKVACNTECRIVNNDNKMMNRATEQCMQYIILALYTCRDDRDIHRLAIDDPISFNTKIHSNNH
jgi:hypothetical protein